MTEWKKGTFWGLVGLVAVTAQSSYAHAGVGGYPAGACGSVPPGWNAPNGAVVFMRHEAGPITAVIDAVGEYRTHTMISHGAGSWATHATMHNPRTNSWPDMCSAPAYPPDLEAGWPGMASISPSAAYQTVNSSSSPTYLRYQIPSSNPDFDNAVGTANWLWWDSEYQWTQSIVDNTQGFYLIGVKDGGGGWHRQSYVLHQFKDIKGKNQGQDLANDRGATVCSTSLAWALPHAGVPFMSAYQYSHNQAVAAGTALQNSVEAQCNADLGFWGTFGAGLACFENVCDDAGRQARNCMGVDACDSDADTWWNSFVADTSATATSLSPDRLGGWSGHPTSGVAAGPWAPYGSQAVTWNSGGNVYGCWF